MSALSTSSTVSATRPGATLSSPKLHSAHSLHEAAHAAGGQTTRGSQSSADPAAATEFPNELRTTPPRVSRSATVVESGTASANVAFTTVICSVDASVHSPEYSSPSGAEKAKSRSISARSTRLSGLATPGQKARGTPPRSVGMSKATVRRSPDETTESELSGSSAEK